MLGRQQSGSDETGPDERDDSGETITAGESLPRIAGYELQRQIGRGGSATVYLAREIKHDRLVALKVLHPALASSIQAERFLREISIIARLAHPNILPLLDSGSVGGQLYYATPYVPGESLRGRLDREKKLPVDDAVRLVSDAAAALDYAHRQGLVHRDVKPENILLADGHALVADFGIARALSLAADDHLTSAGMAIGTPRYMSPEQATGLSLDGRSDIYSLGCVLFELMSGQPPFDGETASDIIGQHASSPVPGIRGTASHVPISIERALRVALAKRPDERFATASAFAESLARDEAAWLDRVLPFPHIQRLPGGALSLVAGVGIAATAIAALVLRNDATSMEPAPVTVDTTRLVVFAVENDTSSGSPGAVDALLNEAIAQWGGVSLVDQFQVAEALTRLDAPPTARQAARVAIQLGAGRFILASQRRRGDSSRVYATLYDASSVKQLHSASESMGTQPSAANVAIGRLALRLLLRGAPFDSLAVTARGSTNLPAVQAFALGHGALSRWDLTQADSLFQVALSFDAGYARANLWSAQVRAWRGEPSDEWRVLAERAAAGDAWLDRREQQLARALVRLGRGEFGEACRLYDQLRLQNDRDFGAWYGLGECRARDGVAVPDTTSPSGWRMRSSYGSAVSAYDRALELLPSSYAGYEHDDFNGLRPLLRVRTSMTPARAAAPDTGQFMARLGIINDTLAMIPYPWELAVSGSREAIPPGFREAEARRTAEFRRLTAGWSAAFPNRSGPKHAVALALEMLGDASAVDTIALARRLATESERAARLGVKEALLRVKFADTGTPDSWVRARSIADSILARHPNADVAGALSPLASLLGRCDAAEQFARAWHPPSSSLPIPAHILRAGEVYLSRAALGCSAGASAPSLKALAVRLDLERISADLRSLTDAIVLYRPLLHTWPPDSAIVERLASSRNADLPLVGALRALVRRDTNATRDLLQEFMGQWHPLLGPPSPDVALPAARLALAIHDSSTALVELDRTLSGLRAYDPWLLDDPVVTASLIRAMVLRADLGHARGDTSTARTWGTAAGTLWATADAELQSIVRRMQRYATQR